MSTQRTVKLYKMGQNVKVAARLEISGSKFIFQPEDWIEDPQQLSTQSSSGNFRLSDRDRNDLVADYKPRALWGEENGEPFTVLDARMVLDYSSPFFRPAQIYIASTILWGAHVDGEESPAEAVRVAFTIKQAGWMQGGSIALRHGQISPWSGGDGAGLTWEPNPPASQDRTVHYFRQRFAPIVQALLELWTGEKVGVHAIEVRLSEAGWCPLKATWTQPITSKAHRPLLSPSDLTMPKLSQWLQLAPLLGPIPFLALADKVPLQPQAQLMTTALEGLHARLYPESNRFTATNKQRQKATKAAAEAAAEILKKSGVEPEVAKRAFREALAQVHRPSYVTRLEELVSRIEATAPGLLGPSANKWIQDIRDVRNTQSHGSTQDDDFGENEISRYYVLAHSARWALQIRLLLELVEEATLQTALKQYDRFLFALANIDREQYWKGYSAYDHFSKTNPKGSRSP